MLRSAPLFRTLVGLSFCLLSQAAQAATPPSRQDGSDPTEHENRAQAPDRPEDMPLAKLPQPPPTKLGSPRPLAIEAIDRLLAQLVSTEALERERASRSLLEAKTDWVSAIARRIDRIAERAQRQKLKKLLSTLREKTRNRMRRETGTREDTPDYLLIALEHAAPESRDWRDLTQLLGLSRMLGAIGSTDGVRELIRIYVRFGEFMRIDTQRQLEELDDRALGALIETRRHPAPNIANWAEKRLKLRKKLAVHDAVRTKDHTALAAILVALGRTRDPDVTRLLISFAGTEQAQVRHAARQGIVLLGSVSSWQLRDAYLNTTGKRAPREWTWKRTARELFTEFDRLRLAHVYALYGKAKKAEEEGDLQAMLQGYNEVLTLNPAFERRDEMVRGYRAYAEKYAASKIEDALLALQRAERIATDDKIRLQTKARRLLLEAQRLKDEGFLDRTLLERARTLDPSLSTQAATVTDKAGIGAPLNPTTRYLVAGALSLIALFGAAWILLGASRKRSFVPVKKTGLAEPPSPQDTST